VVWRIELTPQARAAAEALPAKQHRALAEAFTVLRRHGSTLGRPLVDTVHGSRHRNMKELRPAGTTVRALFAFDPRRVAVVLVVGDKAGDWRDWYRRAIPRADELFARHVGKLEGGAK
jgi:hypothetical protein